MTETSQEKQRHADFAVRLLKWSVAPKKRCVLCGSQHAVDSPHDLENPFYAYRFGETHGRAPTAADAVAHCPPGVRAMTEVKMRSALLWTEPPMGSGGIAEPLVSLDE